MIETSINTNWHIITGAPCSGKTSVINRLAALGFHVAPEVARALLNQLLLDQSLNVLSDDVLSLQQAILNKKLERESKLSPDELVFFDRGLPDSIAYYKFKGLNVREVESLCNTYRYRNVFIFDRLPLQEDEVRIETEAMAGELDHLIRKAYINIGYHPINVPVMSIEDRTKFVLDHSANRS